MAEGFISSYPAKMPLKLNLCLKSPELAAILATLFFGASVVATKAVVEETGAIHLAFMRYGVGTLCIVLIALLTKSPKIAPNDFKASIALGALAFAIFPWLFSQSLVFIPASLGAIILATIPIFTLAIGSLMKAENFTPKKTVGTGMAFFGVAIAMLSQTGVGEVSTFTLSLGSALMFVASVSGAAYNALSQPILQRNDAVSFTALCMASGAIILVPFSVYQLTFFGVPDLVSEDLLSILFLGTFGGGIGFYLWIWALQKATPTSVAIIGTLNPIAATTFAALLLAEDFGSGAIFGLLLIVVGALLVNQSKQIQT